MNPHFDLDFEGHGHILFRMDAYEDVHAKSNDNMIQSRDKEAQTPKIIPSLKVYLIQDNNK